MEAGVVAILVILSIFFLAFVGFVMRFIYVVWKEIGIWDKMFPRKAR